MGVHGVGAADGLHSDLGQADVPNLPGGDQLGQRSDRVLDRGAAVEPVLVVEIDVVGLESLQGAVDGDADIGGAAVQAVAAGVGDQAKFSGQHHLVSPPPQTAGEEFFVDVGTVDLGGVDQGDAEVDSAMDGADGFGVVEARADVGHRHAHSAEAESSNFEIREVSLFHVSSMPASILRRLDATTAASATARVPSRTCIASSRHRSAIWPWTSTACRAWSSSCWAIGWPGP